MEESLRLGTATTRTQTKLLLLGSGELGKEVAIEAQRLGIYGVACDRYDNAPAMQVAHARHVFPMLDGERLRAVIEAGSVWAEAATSWLVISTPSTAVYTSHAPPPVLT